MTADNQMTPELVMRKPADLIPYIGNAKEHTDLQVNQLIASIKEFGFIAPVITNGEDGIIAGHGRILAAVKMGLPEVPTISAAHLTPAQRRAYVLADNRLSEVNTGWDYELLSVELEKLNEDGTDFELVGFDDSYLIDGDGNGDDQSNGDGDGDGSDQDEDTLIRIGEYRIPITGAQYKGWQTEMKSGGGLGMADIHAEILKRLGIS